MKFKKLPRQLVYRDRRNLDDFLRNDELNKELYKVYLRVKDKPYYFKFEAEKAFNEAYYISTLAFNESHPELDVRDWWYLAKDDIGWAYAANLVLSMVYAILSLQKDKPEKIEYVLEIMQGENYGEEHFPAYKYLAENHPSKYSTDFNILPSPVDELPNKIGLWEEITEEFDQDTIRELVSLYPTKDERLKLIDLIEHSQKVIDDFNAATDDLPF